MGYLGWVVDNIYNIRYMYFVCLLCNHSYKSNSSNKISKYLKNREGNLCQFCNQKSGLYDICKQCYTFIKNNNQKYDRIDEYEIED